MNGGQTTAKGKELITKMMMTKVFLKELISSNVKVLQQIKNR